MRHSLSVCVFWGVIVFAFRLGMSAEVPVDLSSAPLLGSATDAAVVVEEPFLNPFGTRKPKIISGFGKRKVPNQPAPEAHAGVDYAAPVGTVVRASRSGKVLFAGFSKMYFSRADKTEQHRFVIIRHPDGRSTRYVHLSGLRIRPGQEVKQGQAIGVTADSDEWTRPVLHFEIRDVQGQPVNPVPLLTDARPL